MSLLFVMTIKYVVIQTTDERVAAAAADQYVVTGTTAQCIGGTIAGDVVAAGVPLFRPKQHCRLA